jgi:hypothetical protein
MSDCFILINVFICAVGLWVLRPLLTYRTSPRMIGEGNCGEIGGMKIGRGNRSTLRKPAPAPLCPHKRLLVYDLLHEHVLIFF